MSEWTSERIQQAHELVDTHPDDIDLSDRDELHSALFALESLQAELGLAKEVVEAAKWVVRHEGMDATTYFYRDLYTLANALRAYNASRIEQQRKETR